jgi:hypothetical protein
MTEFPSIYPILTEGLEIEANDGTEQDFAEDGTPRFRRLFSRPRFSIRFQIGPLTATQKQAVMQFYASYRNQYILWTDPFTTEQYEILFNNPPRVVGYFGPEVCSMELTAVGYLTP